MRTFLLTRTGASTTKWKASHLALAPALFSIELLLGCARLQTFDLPQDPAHRKINSQEKNGLIVSAEILVDPPTIEHHFGPELRKTDYVPVFVYLENRDKNSFEIQRKNFSLVLENGEKLEAVPPDDVLFQIERSTVPAFLLAPLIVPAFVALRSIKEYNFELARTLYQKSFPDSLRLEEKDPPFSRALFFLYRNGKERRQEEFKSSVLQAVVQIEGSRPETFEAMPAQNTKGMVGKLVLFTVSLSMEDAR